MRSMIEYHMNTTYAHNITRNWDAMFTISNGRNIHLQSVGSVPACAIGDLQVGWYMRYNYDHVSKITKIEPHSDLSLKITVESNNGSEFTRVRRKSTLVGFIIP